MRALPAVVPSRTVSRTCATTFCIVSAVPTSTPQSISTWKGLPFCGKVIRKQSPSPWRYMRTRARYAGGVPGATIGSAPNVLVPGWGLGLIAVRALVSFLIGMDDLCALVVERGKRLIRLAEVGRGQRRLSRGFLLERHDAFEAFQIRKGP